MDGVGPGGGRAFPYWVRVANGWGVGARACLPLLHEKQVDLSNDRDLHVAWRGADVAWRGADVAWRGEGTACEGVRGRPRGAGRG